MAMRRPRIKAQANIQLNTKRKSKVTETAKPRNNVELNTDDDHPGDKLTNSIKPSENISINDAVEVVTEKEVRSDVNIAIDTTTTTANENNLSDNDINESDKIEEVNEGGVSYVEAINSSKAGNRAKRDALNDTDAFKCPPKVEYQRSNSHASNNGADDVFYSDIEENALQMDLQKSPNGFPMSPSKNQPRQRIKATPIFGQRRNSFVGTSPSPHTPGPDDNSNNSGNNAPSTPRRERHLSASLSINSNSSSSSHHHHTPHKYLPNGHWNSIGRVRTESGCSVFSDTNTSGHKSRKTDELKTNLKREFEARFVNGIPDKSALKMSDLIYYNPATNPMEQKPNPNIKIENSDTSSTSSSDIKPFKEKCEKDTDKTDVDAEVIPVPQLKLNSNGELILDDKSLVIETTAEQEARKVLANSSLIYLDENTGMNGFYSRQKRTRDWPSAETIKFYRCLQTVGTDFSLMVPLFPNRTRRDLKLKFKKEERINGNLINKALLYPKQFNIEELKQQIEEEDRQREEEANKYKQYKEAAAKELKKKKRKFVRSRADGTLNGDNVYQNENEQNLKKPRKSNNKVTETETVATPPESTPSEETCNKKITTHFEVANVRVNQIKVENDKIKRRRRRAPNIKKESTLHAQHSEQQAQAQPQSIKDELIKNEPVNSTLFVTKTEVYYDGDQLEEEIDQSIHSDTMDMNHINSMSLPECAITQVPPPLTESPISSDCSSTYVNEDNYSEEPMDIEAYYEGRTFVNLDDGSVTTINDANHRPPPSPPRTIINQPTPSPSPPSLQILPPQQQYHDQSLAAASPLSASHQPDLINNDTCCTIMSERELNEQDIEQILTELAEGSLVLVSTLDPEDPDKVLNEIFMVDKNTGDLCDEPLNIPDNIVQCILSVMS